MTSSPSSTPAAEAGPPPVVLPARWGPLQRLKNDLVYALVVVGFAALRRAPVGLTRALLGAAARVAWACAIPIRRRSLAHLALALPELDRRTHRRIVRAMFAHHGQSAAELVHLERSLEEVALDAGQRRLFEEALAEGKGVVAVTGHIGNWELLAQAVAREVDTTAIARPLYDPRLTAWAHRRRSAHGLGLIWRGDLRGAREMLSVFRRGSVLALLIDQDSRRVQGTFVPFFGRLAYTPRAAAALALRTGAPVIVGWHHRRGPGHALHFERIATGDLPADDEERAVQLLTQRLTARLEEAIRRAPEQWVWWHQRWRTRP